MRSLLAAVLAQRMRNLVPHDGGELVIGRIELGKEPGVDGDFAPRHAPGVDFVGADHVDFPGPARCIRAECAGVRDQAVGDAAHSLDLSGVSVKLPLLVRSLQHLLIFVGARAAIQTTTYLMKPSNKL